MAVETSATYIQDLNPNLPARNDFIAEGDDHMRLTKEVVINTFPTANKPLTVDFDKVNNLDKVMDYDQILKLITLSSVKVSGLVDADPKNLTDAVNVRSLIDIVFDTYYPVGSVYISVDSQFNPATSWRGTWELASQGKAMVGADSAAYALGTTGGSEEVVMTPDNLPAHKHEVNITSDASGAHHHDFSLALDDEIGGSGISGQSFSPNLKHVNTSSVPNHTHHVSGYTENFGAGVPLNVVQPWEAFNIWKRTA